MSQYGRNQYHPLSTFFPAHDRCAKITRATSSEPVPGSLSIANTTTSMASTSSTPLDMYGLTASQLSELQGAVQELDAYLLVWVNYMRKDNSNRWVHTKDIADCRVRDLLVIFFLFFFFSFSCSFFL